MMRESKNHIQRLVGTALLAAVVLVLQFFVTIPIGTFYVTLTLVPIMLGAMLYGPGCGAFLGGVFGVAVSAQVIMGAAGAYSTMMLEQNPVVTILVCLTKGIVAGLASGLIYRLFVKLQKETLGSILAAIVCPICNTGIFSIALLTVFRDLASGWALENSYVSIFAFLVFFMIGLNFVVEFIINVLLAPVAFRVIKIVRRRFL